MADDEDRIMSTTPRSRVRAILRAIGRGWMRAHALPLPPPSPADVAQASRCHWRVTAKHDGGWECRASCGAVVAEGEATDLESAEHIAQSVAMRLRRYAVQ